MPSSTIAASSARRKPCTARRRRSRDRNLARHGTPERQQDTASHNVISYTYWSPRDEWEFTTPNGKKETVKTKPRLHANNGDTCVAAALQDHGIVLQPDFLVHESLRDGRLQQLLGNYQTVELGVYAVYSSRRQLPLKLRALIDFLVEAFQRPAWGMPED